MNRIGREALDGSRNISSGSQHRRGRSLVGISGDRDENLDLFSRNRRSHSTTFNDESDVLMKLGRLSIGSVKLPKSGMDDLLASTDGGKHDYDWLLTPPGTPLFSSSDANETPPTAPRRNSTVRSSSSTAKTSRLSVTHSENSHSTRPTRSSSVTRPSISSTHYSHSSNKTSVLNTSSASVTSLRPSTPTTRSTLTSSTRSSAPTARSTPVRSSTPSKTRPSISSSSENKTRPTQNPRPSTPTARPQIPANVNYSASRSNSRPSTPTRRTPTPALTSPAGRSTSVGRVPPANGRSSAPASRTNSPGPRARPPPQPIVLPDFPLDAPPNLRTSLPERPVSAGRSRPGVSVTARVNSETAGPVNPPRRQSSSPIATRGRLLDLSGRPRLHSNGHDPPEIQKPMVSDAAVRRPIKPAASTESTGFGRTISKKSLDMALKHMDIRQSMGNNIRALTGTSLFPQSIRSSASKGRPGRVSDTPPAINSNGVMSETRNGIDRFTDHETNSGDKRLAAKFGEIDPYESSRYDAILLEDAKNTNWLHSIDDKSSDQSPVFDHRFEPLPEPFGLL